MGNISNHKNSPIMVKSSSTLIRLERLIILLLKDEMAMSGLFCDSTKLYNGGVSRVNILRFFLFEIKFDNSVKTSLDEVYCNSSNNDLPNHL